LKGELADFGRSRGVGAVLPKLVIGGAFATLALGTAWGLLSERAVVAKSTADTGLAAIVGPPCRGLSPDAAQRSLKAMGVSLGYVFDFNGDRFGRVFGHADCSVAASGDSLGFGSYDVCQFSSPAILYVKASRGEAYFAPGIGQKATVMTPDGKPRCVLSAPKWDD
jgi:hypothetical protein